MKQIRLLAQYYVNLLVKLGLVRFSLLLACVLVGLAVIIQIFITLVLNGKVYNSDILRSIFFGLLITPWVIYFLSVVVDQLEESRQRLSKFVSKLEEMRTKDMHLNHQLKENIDQLNLEIEERKRAEGARKDAILRLENEIMQREKVQHDLAEQTALLRSFIDASPDLIYYRNEQGQFSGCNKAMEELTGKLESELVGLTPWDVYSKDVAMRIVETDLEVFSTNTSITYEQWLEYKDGRKAYFELRKLPFYSRTGQRLGLVGFGRESTERKLYQDALEKASREKTAFISTISHELRTPLNGIVGLSRILLETKLTNEQLGYLRTIHVSAITLGNIFNDIIDLDKSDRSRLALLPQPLDLPDFISEIENISGLMTGQKGLRFSLERLTDFPPTIDIDATRLRQILWNLVGNAVKFTKQGAINLTVGCDIIDNIAHLQFEIEDSGIGIPSKELENIFTMYYQVKEGDDNLHAVGTGIGLAVSRKLARMMGGDILVESEIGEGTIFTLSIPAPISKNLPNTNIVVTKQPSLNILLVEDIELNIMVATNLLESLKHKVTAARCGREALDIFAKGHFDLLLLDIQLPDMTGFDVAEKLRKTYQSLPPMVALTANVIRDKNEYIEKGLDDAISKPINVTAISEMIERLILSCSEPEKLSKISDIQAKELDKQSQKANNEMIESLLDLTMLSSYIDIVGASAIHKSIDMFERLMPEYIKLLDDYLINKNQDEIVNEAHKIKGAAGSIGLKHIQQVAQKAQSPELEGWWDNIENWIDEIKMTYVQDLIVLRCWVDDYNQSN